MQKAFIDALALCSAEARERAAMTGGARADHTARSSTPATSLNLQISHALMMRIAAVKDTASRATVLVTVVAPRSPTAPSMSWRMTWGLHGAPMISNARACENAARPKMGTVWGRAGARARTSAT